ncbi:MAG: capsular polysaccharide biosynthesis protein CapF [Cloacibacillus sp.]
MKILVTGANGFIGRNLITELRSHGYTDIYEYDIDNTEDELDAFTADCGFIFHLAGINRPQNQEEFMQGNFGFTSVLLNKLKRYNNKSPIMLSSSIQAELDNPYGKSKKAGEELLFEYAKENGTQAYIYRFPNVFGKWCRPNYNSAVATFCHNIANGLPIKVNDRNTAVNLVYIDDILKELRDLLNGKANIDAAGRCYVPITYTATLGQIADLLYSFKDTRALLSIPDMSDNFTKKLYSTYLSYIPTDQFAYPLKMNIDSRGSFTEMIRTTDRGQFSVNITKPGITKGNHWHHTKNEKFAVVSGNAKISFRRLGTNEIIDYNVSGDKIEIVDIPTGYTHSITNTGTSDLITFMWVNEPYDPDRPDTYIELVCL